MANVTLKLITRMPDGTQEVIELKGVTSDSLAHLKSLWEAERAINEWSPVRAHLEVSDVENEVKY